MDKVWQNAYEEEVCSALEIMYEHESLHVIASDVFGLKAALSFVNFGCIKDTDHVIAIGSHLGVAALLVSYLYTPKKLVIEATGLYNDVYHSVWGNINQLLSGYRSTQPIYSDFDADPIEYGEESFDAAIVGYAAKLINCSWEAPDDRFILEVGEEFDYFELILLKSSKLLKKDGRLVVLAKPGWVLKLWNLIQDLGLQMEYDYYHLYIGSTRFPNSFVWLRFVKRNEDMDLKFHKKNILSLMNTNNIDRLYAHRNNLRFPYVELSYNNTESYVLLNQHSEFMQYFFSVETTARLAELCVGYTACLVTPSVARYAHNLNKNIVLFERDNRFRENGGLKFVKYDLKKGLTKLLQNKYMKKFNIVVCDPPFDIKLDILASDIDELLKTDNKSVAYVIFPSSRETHLKNAMMRKGLMLNEVDEKIGIVYAKPPKLVRVHGRDAIQLYKFTYKSLLS